LGVALLESMKMLEPASILTLEFSRRLPLHFQNGNAVSGPGFFDPLRELVSGRI
jgi:hypothetical protein